jgi:hypothetical protein
MTAHFAITSSCPYTGGRLSGLFKPPFHGIFYDLHAVSLLSRKYVIFLRNPELVIKLDYLPEVLHTGLLFQLKGRLA